jgi:hypothetical protein
MVCVVLFTTMLLANAALYSAEDSYSGAVGLSSAQQQERDYASVLVGLSSYSSLAWTQHFLQNTPMDCSSAQSYLASMSGGVSRSDDNQSDWYSVKSSWGFVSAPVSSLHDPLLPAQFDGYSAGDLNILVRTDLNETFVGGLPSYSAQYLETVHLPVQPVLAASQCLTALSDLKAEFSTLRSCTVTAVDQDVSLVRASAGLGASEAGASFRAVGAHCLLTYWVRITQTGIQGVSGTFQWTVFASGSLST